MMKIGVLALYALMMVAVIVLTARKKLSLNEFLLGGRNVGPWLSALSYGASYFSAVIIVGYAGSTGWSGNDSICIMLSRMHQTLPDCTGTGNNCPEISISCFNLRS